MPKSSPTVPAAYDRVAFRILDAATHLFATRGYEATTLQEVAARVRMTAPALYWYFDSKQRLLFEVIRGNLARFNDEMRDTFATLDTDAPQAARLAAFVRAHLRFQLEKTDRARVYNAMFLGTRALLDALTPRQRQEVRALQDVTVGALREILRAGAARSEFAVDDVAVAAFAIVAIGEYAAAWFDPRGRLSATDIAEQYATMAVRMVARPVARLRRTPHRVRSAR